MDLTVNKFLVVGCGRCSKGGTLDCNARIWGDILKQLRSIILETGLTEEIKWSHPCYTYKGTNVLLLGAFNGYASLNFVKGELLKDSEKILIEQTENIESARQVHFTHVSQVIKLEATLESYILEAIEMT